MEKDVALVYLTRGRPVAELVCHGRFTYVAKSDEYLEFRSFAQMPEDDTFHRSNEVSRARSRGEALPYTNLIRIRREGARFVAECYFEGPKLRFYNGKNLLLDTGMVDVAMSEPSREAIQKLLDDAKEPLSA